MTNSIKEQLNSVEWKTEESWQQIPWPKIQRHVFRLRKRIYQAAKRGDFKTVRGLQKLLLKSWSAKCLAVNQITNEPSNLSKKVILSSQKLALVKTVNFEKKVHGQKTDILGIREQANLNLINLAIEAESDNPLENLQFLREVKAKDISQSVLDLHWYDAKSKDDAFNHIKKTLKTESKYILKLDLSQCLDLLKYQELCNYLPNLKSIKRYVKSCFKTFLISNKSKYLGINNQNNFQSLTIFLSKYLKQKIIKMAVDRLENSQVCVVKFRDSLIILATKFEITIKYFELIKTSLNNLGINLKPQTLLINHSLQKSGMQTGFDFLGCHIQQYQSRNRPRLATLITPSKESCKQHHAQLAKVIRKHKNAPQSLLIAKLNQIIKQWSNNYSQLISSQKELTRQDHLLRSSLRSWAIRRHPNKSQRWIFDKYWQTINSDNKIFSTTNENEIIKLYSHRDSCQEKPKYDQNFSSSAHSVRVN